MARFRAGFQFPGGSLARTPPRPLALALPLVTALVTSCDQIRRRGPGPVRGRRCVTDPIRDAAVGGGLSRLAQVSLARRTSPGGRAGKLHTTDAVSFACSYAFAFALLGCTVQKAYTLAMGPAGRGLHSH
jgi:hypothetical protein